MQLFWRGPGYELRNAVVTGPYMRTAGRIRTIPGVIYDDPAATTAPDGVIHVVALADAAGRLWDLQFTP